ncbi:MAG TPA: GNAT family N-acetyltransferase [Casimicrobiaceae bacterium]|nr:GNAT family N-acetyltransferase [Casimicrobiaceae bacterium]
MEDMLVRLYAIPSVEEALAACSARGVSIRRAIVPERPAVVEWVRARFASSVVEVETAFAQVPVTCFIALRNDELLGFACYDVTCLNFFGPEGVAAAERGNGIGRALLLRALQAQRARGYAYAIIGGVGPAQFYERAAGAIPIPGSTPGIYAGFLRR